jgi:hypothetical protein
MVGKRDAARRALHTPTTRCTQDRSRSLRVSAANECAECAPRVASEEGCEIKCEKAFSLPCPLSGVEGGVLPRNLDYRQCR